jgi:hypothetical protein
MNFIFLLTGLTVTGFAVYALVRYNALELALPKKSIGGVCGLGGALALFSLFGYWAAKGQRKCALTTYAILVAALVVGQIIAGSAVLHFTGKLNDPSKAINEDADLDRLVSCTYDFCCQAEGTPAAQPCADYQSWLGSDVCKVLPGDYSTPGAGECVSFDTFKASLLQWLQDHEEPVGIATLTLGGLQFVAIVSAFALICGKTPAEEALLEEEKQRLYYEQAGAEGGQLEYGATVTLPPPATNPSYVPPQDLTGTRPLTYA